jgi:hypothetical protein
MMHVHLAHCTPVQYACPVHNERVPAGLTSRRSVAIPRLRMPAAPRQRPEHCRGAATNAPMTEAPPAGQPMDAAALTAKVSSPALVRGSEAGSPQRVHPGRQGWSRWAATKAPRRSPTPLPCQSSLRSMGS